MYICNYIRTWQYIGLMEAYLLRAKYKKHTVKFLKVLPLF
jgi:hypothetical protein